MKYLSDSGAAKVDIRVDYPETFWRKFQIVDGEIVITSAGEVLTVPIKYDGSITDYTYFDAEFLIWYSKQDKILENFNFTNNELAATGGELEIDQDLSINEGVYKYHLLIEDSNGRKYVLIKGDFIYKKE